MKCIIGFFLTLLLAYVLIVIIYSQEGVEFVNSNYENIYFYFKLFGLPFIILLIGIASTFTRNKLSKKSMLARVLIGICIAFFMFCFQILNEVLNFNMCGYTIEKTLFENIETSSKKIVSRSFGCGATDSSPATSSTYKQENYLLIFHKFTKVEIAQLDKQKWKKIDE